MGEKANLVLGIDSSTQSTTGLVLECDTFKTLCSVTIKYRDDPRLAFFGFGEGAPILPAREEGEADQPAALFLAALDALLIDIGSDILSRVCAINFSAQQHGQVWLTEDGEERIQNLDRTGRISRTDTSLADLIVPGFASERAPIWMTSNTAQEAERIRQMAGGENKITELSGSNSPLRFSGAVLRHKALVNPQEYSEASRVHLISSFLAAIMAGEPLSPIDWGNGSGMSLMNWREREWDNVLLDAVAGDLPGGGAGLLKKLPELAHPLKVVGPVASYFVERHGFNENCQVIAGSGDNPQSKVLASGALLSLGTSYVLMVEGIKPVKSANAMYDGLGRPFLFGCRTNGAIVWESIRTSFRYSANDFEHSDVSLKRIKPGAAMRVVQLERESFPDSPAMALPSLDSFDENYAAVVDSSLGLMVLASRAFAPHINEISITGGAAASKEVLARVATMWAVPVSQIPHAGAACGAAIAAMCAIAAENDRAELAHAARAVVAKPLVTIKPVPEDVNAVHGKGGYLERLAEEFGQAGGRFD